jgi:uncharacterized membrane protein (UPF0127 family)
VDSTEARELSGGMTQRIARGIQAVESFVLIPHFKRMQLCRRAGILIVCLAGAALAGCEKRPVPLPATQPALSDTNVAPSRFGPITNAQPKLPVLKLQVGNEVVVAELARKPLELATGMMFRKSMAEEEGMLFAQPYPQPASFYMRNTTVPLSIAYIDPSGKILELHDLKALDETPVPSSAPNILYVLEMNQGWFTRHGVTPGVTIVSEQGPLSDTVKFQP